jgi:hypothetical protein
MVCAHATGRKPLPRPVDHRRGGRARGARSGRHRRRRARQSARLVHLLVHLLALGVDPVDARLHRSRQHFSVAFPVTPISQSETLPVNGTDLTITEYVATVSSTDQYEAGYVPYPDSVDTSNPSVNLAGAVQGAVTSTGGTLLSQSQGTYQGFPSVDFLLSAQGEYIDYRVVLDGHSLYQVAVASTVNPPANFTSFASSLKILAP